MLPTVTLKDSCCKQLSDWFHFNLGTGPYHVIHSYEGFIELEEYTGVYMQRCWFDE